MVILSFNQILVIYVIELSGSITQSAINHSISD